MSEFFNRGGFAGAPPSHAEAPPRHPDTPPVDWIAALASWAEAWMDRGDIRRAVAYYRGSTALAGGVPLDVVFRHLEPDEDDP